MKFDYCKDQLEYKFNFIVSEYDVRKYLHKHGLTYDFVYGLFPATTSTYHKILASVDIVRYTLSDEKVDLGIDYKKKYEELVELLEPHKIDETMEPVTTLKMILRYNK